MTFKAAWDAVQHCSERSEEHHDEYLSLKVMALKWRTVVHAAQLYLGTIAGNPPRHLVGEPLRQAFRLA